MVSYCYHLPPLRVNRRTSEELSNKWLDLDSKTSTFKLICDNVYENRETVWNDIDIMTKARQEYQSRMERCFGKLSTSKRSPKRTKDQSPNTTIYRPSMENNTKWNRLWCLLYETYEDLHGGRPKKWNSGLMNEHEGHNKQLNQLRFKYLCKILMSNVNFLKEDILVQSRKHDAMDEKKKKWPKTILRMIRAGKLNTCEMYLSTTNLFKYMNLVI
ncbi:hypothetical protein R6Q57_010232 [Mikania cordata]